MSRQATVAKQTTETRKIDDLVEPIFVRVELDEDWALHLSIVLDGGGKLPPILIANDNQVVDGRHRKMAHRLSNRTEIECLNLGKMSREEMITRSFLANYDPEASKPFGKSDIEHTVELLLKEKTAVKRIADMLGLPLEMIKKYADTVRHRIKEQNMHKAIRAVSDGGYSAPRAAEEFDVDIESLRGRLRGGRNKKKENGPDEMKAHMTQCVRSQGSKLGHSLKKAFQNLDDGVWTPDQVEALVQHAQDQIKRQGTTINNWATRLEAKIATVRK